MVFNLFKGKIIILFKLFNGVGAKIVSWYKFKKKSGVKNMLEFFSGWINRRQNRGGAVIISLNNTLKLVNCYSCSALVMQYIKALFET